jgi:hypothetical protein
MFGLILFLGRSSLSFFETIEGGGFDSFDAYSYRVRTKFWNSLLSSSLVVERGARSMGLSVVLQLTPTHTVFCACVLLHIQADGQRGK